MKFWSTALGAAMAVACLFGATPAAADNMAVRDAANVLKQFCTKTQGGIDVPCELFYVQMPDGTIAPAKAALPYVQKGHDTLTAGTTTSRKLLPTSDDVVVVKNLDTVEARFKLGDSTVVATTTDFVLSPGETRVISAAGATYLAGITASSTARIDIVTGYGVPVVVSAGSAAGGSTSDATAAKQDIGNASVASIDTKATSTNTKLDTLHTDVGTTLHADVDGLETLAGTTNTNLGAPGATACATDTGSCSLNALIQRLAQRQTSTITAIGSPFQVGGALGAGSAIIGKVGIDQTTPGTTNKVYISTDGVVGLATGSNLVGSVKLSDGTTTPAVRTAAAGDAQSALAALAVADHALIYNGSTWDRVTAIFNGLNSTGTGITASGMVCQLDDTSTGSVTENQFAAVRCTPSREVKTNDASANIALGAPGDTAWTTGSGSAIALLKAIAAATTSTSASAVKIDHTTPGTTDQVLVGATENHMGEVGGNQISVQVAQTVTASSAYTSGNAIGGLMTVSNAARVSGSAGAAGTSGLVQSVVINSKSAQTTQVDVFLFSANPTGSTCTDKTAFSLASADFDKVLGVASIPATTGWFSGGTASFGQAQNLAIPYALSSATAIYACAVTRATPTFSATSDISFGFRLLRN